MFTRCRWALFACLLATACSTVESTSRARDSDTIVVDQDYFATHADSAAAWLTYAFDRAAALREQGKAAACGQEYLLELAGRRKLVDYWAANGTPGTDSYLDVLVEIAQRGFLEEYVIAAFGAPGWTLSSASIAGLDVPSFAAWGQQNLQGHSSQTRAHLEYYCPAVAGASYPGVQSFFGLQGQRCDETDSLDDVLERWEVDRRALAGRLLASSTGMQFLWALDGLGNEAEQTQGEVTWVPEPIAQLKFLAGFCAIERTDWDAARQYLDGAISLAPDNHSIRLELVHVAISTRDFGGAEEQIDVVLANTQDPCLVAQALRKRGYIQFERGELAEAHATYTESLNHEPGSEVAKNELMSIHQMMQARGYADLPPPFFIAPPSNQLTTQCTLDG